MKTPFWFWGLCLFPLFSSCISHSSSPPTTARSDALNSPVLVEAACGQCQLGVAGKGCDLAVRIDGKSYFVDGISGDQLWDAHAADGICNRVRRARVTGQLMKDRFVVATFEFISQP